MDESFKQKIMNFWYDFDNTFHFQIQPSIDQYYKKLFPSPNGFDDIAIKWLHNRQNNSYPDGFKNEISPLKSEIIGLANEQIKLFANLNKDPNLIQKAFEDFGQGILYDDRRPLKLHKMDGNPPTPLIGYFRWHTFISALILFNEFDQLWPKIDQYVGLAWEIQSNAPTIEQDPNNPGLDDTTLNRLREKWLSMSSQQLDDEFESGFSTSFP